MLFANISLSYRATRIIIENEQWVTHTYQVLGELDKTISTLTDAEAGQQGYLLILECLKKTAIH
jgi:CHASE3 domain sensor protein